MSSRSAISDATSTDGAPELSAAHATASVIQLGMAVTLLSESLR
jgi:hypothetical protein